MAFAGEHVNLCYDDLPKSIRQVVDTSYQGWSVASAGVLNRQDRERFEPLIGNKCYGVIRGSFTKEGVSYAVYLLKTKEGGYMNQLVVFQDMGDNVSQTVLIPPSFAASAIILRKMPNRTKHTVGSTGKESPPSHDVIDLLDPDKGEVRFFWKGEKFVSVATAE
jgi:hypothetical protein